METDNTKNKELILAVKEAQLEPSQVENLLSKFGKSFQEAKSIAGEAKSIIVTDASQTVAIAKARKVRLDLKNIRIEVEKTRITLKEQSLREGKAIDGMANIIKALIIPVEEHLQAQEDFAKIREEKRLADRHADRIAKLSVYVEDVTLYTLKDMTEEAFVKLLESSKAAFDARKEAEAKVEAERVENERKEKLYNERRLNLAPYNQFRDGETMMIGLNTTEDEYQKVLAKCKDLKVKYDADQVRILKENETLKKKVDADRKAREDAEKKLEDEKKVREEQDRKEKEDADAKLREEEEIKRKALLAPDKDKLIGFAGMIDILQLPAVASREAGIVLNEVGKKLAEISFYLREKAKTL